ncbi:hypothetical protein ACXWOQ_10045, partial [Streptococcus pyogenes]
LVVLITPYILNDSHDAEAMTDAFRHMLGPWAAPVAGPAAPGAVVPAVPSSAPEAGKPAP